MAKPIPRIFEEALVIAILLLQVVCIPKNMAHLFVFIVTLLIMIDGDSVVVHVRVATLRAPLTKISASTNLHNPRVPKCCALHVGYRGRFATLFLLCSIGKYAILMTMLQISVSWQSVSALNQRDGFNGRRLETRFLVTIKNRGVKVGPFLLSLAIRHPVSKITCGQSLPKININSGAKVAFASQVWVSSVEIFGVV